MPDALVKSLPSSTSALAGSHAAQHSVSCLACADAGPLATDDSITPVKSASAPPVSFDHIPLLAFRMCFPSPDAFANSPRRAFDRRRVHASRPGRAEAMLRGELSVG